MFEYDGYTFTLAEMLSGEARLWAELRNWLMLAQVGDSEDFGGGAHGASIIRCIA